MEGLLDIHVVIMDLDDEIMVISALLTYPRRTTGHYRTCLDQCLVEAKTERKQITVCGVPG